MTATREFVIDVNRATSPDPAATIAARFLLGDEHATELLIRLARENGGSLLEIYEQLRIAVAAATAGPNPRGVHENELDESLVRLVARLRPPLNHRPEWKACIISTAGHGVAACVSHLLADADVASIVAASPSGEGSTMSAADVVARLLPTVQWVVIDGSRAHATAVSDFLADIQHLDFAAARTTLVLLAEPGRADDADVTSPIPDLVVVDSLTTLLAALDITVGNPLTGREREVLGLVAVGATNEQVARRLDVAVSTVKTYLERIHVKLKSRDRASAVATAMQRQWL